MGKKSRNFFNFFSLVKFLIIGAAFALSCYLLVQLPTKDNVLSIVYVTFTGFALLETIVGWMGNCSESKCLLKMGGCMGILGVVIFAILTVLSGLWYGGIQVLPESSFDGQNITVLCAEFNQITSNANVTRGDNPLDNPTSQPQISNGTEIDQTTNQPSTTNKTTGTAVSTLIIEATESTTEGPNTEESVSFEENDEELNSNSTLVDNETGIIKKTLDDIKRTFDFDETRLLHNYCKLEGLMRDLIFGRTDESKATPVMLAVLIVSAILFVLYIITTILAFHNARRVDSTQFNSW